MKKKEPIRLRQKSLANGNVSLYLDIYQNGVRKYEFLKLYLVPEKTKLDKERNRTTLLQAEKRKTERILQLQQGKFGAVAGGLRTRISDVVREVGSMKLPQTAEKYTRLANYITRYGDVPVQRCDKSFLTGFISFLCQMPGKHGHTMSGRTLRHHLSCLGLVFKYAMRNGMLAENPFNYIDPDIIPKQEPRRITFLSMAEVGMMASAPCIRPMIKNAFMFACFTGLRYSDLKALLWSDIQDGFIIMKQKKTNDIVRIPVSSNARRWMPEKTGRNVFPGLPPSAAYYDHSVDKWARDAGIERHITFHVSRHTFATMLLTYGADIYTASKLLGHRSIDTTQIYAEVIDAKKVDAINNIPDME